MSYKCMKCGSVIDALPEGLVRCPNCAFKVLLKERPSTTKKIKAI